MIRSRDTDYTVSRKCFSLLMILFRKIRNDIILCKYIFEVRASLGKFGYETANMVFLTTISSYSAIFWSRAAHIPRFVLILKYISFNIILV